MTQTRSARIEARTTPDTLAMVGRAAELQGRSVSAFVIAAAEPAARRTIEDAQIIRLAAADQVRFVAALRPPRRLPRPCCAPMSIIAACSGSREGGAFALPAARRSGPVGLCQHPRTADPLLPGAGHAGYPSAPLSDPARLGRLAVDTRFIGQTLGAALLADAVIRAAASEVAVFAVVVDAKDPQAGAFWRHHGFAACGSAPGKLIAPLATLLPQG